MIISPQSLDTNLSQLLAEVKSGSMQLPEFQRDWTWDDNRIDRKSTRLNSSHRSQSRMPSSA